SRAQWATCWIESPPARPGSPPPRSSRCSPHSSLRSLVLPRGVQMNPNPGGGRVSRATYYGAKARVASELSGLSEISKRLSAQAVAQPIAVERSRAQVLVKAYGQIVPGQHLPLHPTAPTAHGFYSAGFKQCHADPASAKVRQHEQVFEIKRRQRHDG